MSNISTNLFIVVSELPTEDIKEGKIYCIRDTSSTAQDNNYIEYAYINNKWEKVGEFQAKPDLSGYAKLSGARFTGKIEGGSATFNDLFNTVTGTLYIGTNSLNTGRLIDNSYRNRSDTKTYNTNGGYIETGTPEDFIFTLEDGTKVTKSIRVISTTTSQNVVNNNDGKDGE
nr:MAG TPA: hypothetical protein [Caudoviricetes sp.]